MSKSRLMNCICILLLALSVSTVTNASIIYNVDRIIDNGTVTGFIETDGTLGVLGDVNIIDWTFTLTAPNLYLGSPDVVSIGESGGSTSLVGTGVTATSTQLLFDFSLAGERYALFIGGLPAQNGWCLSTAAADCTGDGVGEHIFWPSTGQGNPGAAQSLVHADTVVFAEVQTVPVPAAA